MVYMSGQVTQGVVRGLKEWSGDARSGQACTHYRLMHIYRVYIVKTLVDSQKHSIWVNGNCRPIIYSSLPYIMYIVHVLKCTCISVRLGLISYSAGFLPKFIK